jgi:hypothetical protein
LCENFLLRAVAGLCRCKKKIEGRLVINVTKLAVLLQWNNFSVNLIHKIHHCVNLYVLEDGRDTL